MPRFRAGGEQRLLIFVAGKQTGYCLSAYRGASGLRVEGCVIPLDAGRYETEGKEGRKKEGREIETRRCC